MEPTSIEKQFVYFLTRVYWWVEMKLQKSIFWYSVAINFFVVFVINIIVFSIIEISLEVLFLMTIDTFFSPLVFYFLAGFPNDRDGIIKNTLKSPNPNLYGYGLFKARSNIVAMFVAVPFLAWYENLFYTAVIFACTISMYSLCVEAMPPHEKEKQKLKNNVQRLATAT